MCASIDRSSISSASVAAGLLANLMCFVFSICSLLTLWPHKPVVCSLLAHSLPRDVCTSQTDHLGGQGRTYTSNLNFVCAHLSKPGHRRGCCCKCPRCLLRQFVDHCLLSWALFIEKTVLLCFAQFLSEWRETALWMFQDATQAGTSCTFDGFHDNGDRVMRWFRLVENEGDRNDG